MILSKRSNVFKVVPWSEDLDLTEFYLAAKNRGFVNNSCQKFLVDCFNNEQRKQIWILYKGNQAIGSVAAHSFDDVTGPNTYRICARTCTLAEARPSHGLITTKRLICEHQNLTAQFLIPTCIEWAPKDAKLYITSNNSKEASQRLVHNIYFPTLEKIGTVKKIKDVEYRGHLQTVWQLFPDVFYEQLNRYPRWT